jgi:hypothetical protein
MTASPIRDSAGKLAITPGVWRHVHTLDYSQGIYSDNGKAPLESIKYEGLYLANLADGDLMAEAGTVTNQTNRTPAELAALVRELRGVLGDVRSLPVARSYPDGPCIESYLMDDVISALAKSEGV